MAIPLNLRVDASSPIPIRRQLTEQLKHVIESGSLPQRQTLPSIRELAGFLGINANTVARVIDDLKRSGYVEARRGRGVFVASAPPVRLSPRLREGFLHDVMMRAAALGMSADDLAVRVLSRGGVPPTAIEGAVDVLLVECSAAELDSFARQLEAHLPIAVDKVLLDELADVTRRRPAAGRWRAAVTSFCHLPDVERVLKGKGVPVVAVLAEVHLETLHRLAQLPAGTRVGVASDAADTAHNMVHSLANAALPNIALIGSSPTEGAALGRLLRRVDVIVCSSAAAERVRERATSGVQLIIDDRALDQRTIQMLAVHLVQPNRRETAATPPAAETRPPHRGKRRRPAKHAAARTK